MLLDFVPVGHPCYNDLGFLFDLNLSFNFVKDFISLRVFLSPGMSST